MNKLKRILFTFFIFAYLLAQFESVKAESVKAEYTDAANTEVITEVLETDREPINFGNGLVTAPLASEDNLSTANEEILPQTIIKEQYFNQNNYIY